MFTCSPTSLALYSDKITFTRQIHDKKTKILIFSSELWKGPTYQESLDCTVISIGTSLIFYYPVVRVIVCLFIAVIMLQAMVDPSPEKRPSAVELIEMVKTHAPFSHHHEVFDRIQKYQLTTCVLEQKFEVSYFIWPLWKPLICKSTILIFKCSLVSALRENEK